MKEELEKLNNGFIKYHDFELVSLTKDKVTIKAPLDEKGMNPYGMAHGGLIYALGDTVMGVHCFSLGHQGVTLNASINYLNPGKGTSLIAESELIKEGRHISFFKANIYDENHNIVANMEANYYYK